MSDGPCGPSGWNLEQGSGRPGPPFTRYRYVIPARASATHLEKYPIASFDNEKTRSSNNTTSTRDALGAHTRNRTPFSFNIGPQRHSPGHDIRRR